MITVSDSSALLGKKDLTGPAVAELLAKAGYQIVDRTVLPNVSCWLKKCGKSPMEAELICF